MAEQSGSVRRTSKSVDAFIAANDPDGTLAAVDTVLVGALPGASRVLWQGVFWGGTDQSIIGYRDIRQLRPRGTAVDWFLVGLARQKSYVSIYVNAAEDGQYLSKLYGARLGRTRVGSASLSFKSVDDIDLDVLRELAQHAERIQVSGEG